MKSIRAIAQELGCSHSLIFNYKNKGQLPKNKAIAAAIVEYFGDDFLNKKEEEVVMLSYKAKEQFGLVASPFVDDVNNHEDVFKGANQRYVSQYMWLTAKNAGFIAVVGESGSGKSILRRELIDKIRREEANIVVIQPQTIDKTKLTAGAICDSIINDLSEEAPLRTLEAKARQIQRLLIVSSRAGNSHVLLIEEAHDLSKPVMKYLKRFWELEDGFKKLIGIILVGQPELKMRLSIQHNWDAREVVRRCEIVTLEPLSAQDLEEYLVLKFGRLSLHARELFCEGFGANIVAKLTHNRGNNNLLMTYPLIINNLVTRLLNMAADVGIKKIDKTIIIDA